MKEVQNPVIEDASAQECDDLTRILGINPAFEKRLNSAGIYTFTELQSKSPEALAKLFIGQKGVSARLIREMDWIGQARELAEKIESEETAFKSQSEQHYAMFTVEFLLDKENHVRRTRVTPVDTRDQSVQEPKILTGSDPEGVLKFLVEHAKLSIPEQKPIAGKSAQAEGAPEDLSLKGQLQISRMDLQYGGDGSTGGNGKFLIQQGKSVNFHLELDFSGVMAPPETSLNFRASIYSKELESGIHQMIGDATGVLLPIQDTIINVGIRSLQQGLYRLYAIVIVSLPGKEPSPGSGLMATKEGGLFPVI